MTHPNKDHDPIQRKNGDRHEFSNTEHSSQSPFFPIQRVLLDGGMDDIPPEIAARARRHLDALREKMAAKSVAAARPARPVISLRRWMAWATPVAALAMLGILVVMITTEVTGQTVYAQAVRRIREALTLQVSMVTRFEGAPEMKLQVAFRNDGLVRVDMPGEIHSIIDSRAMKTFTVDRRNRMIVEGTLANMPQPQSGRDPAREIERLRRLPERASEELGEKTLGGRPVLGYRVTEKDEIDEVWIDADTRELVQIDARCTSFAGVTTSMTDFRFDGPLPQDTFSTATPAGFRRQTFNLDLANASETDFIEFLKQLVRFTPDGTFPPSMNPVEIQKLVTSHPVDNKDKTKDGAGSRAGAGSTGGIKPEAGLADLVKIKKETMAAAGYVARGMLFIISMKPENDWHYVGGGVKPGDAKATIAWWKPIGAKNYKVIYGDLSVREEPPGAVPTAK